MSHSSPHYFHGLSWAVLTREERLFCARLYELGRDRLPELVRLVATRDDRSRPRSKPLDLDPGGRWELAYEAALYRDLRFHCRRRREGRPDKRTFDLALFGDDRIVIFEAKAQQGFDNAQLDDFKLDRRRVQDLLGVEPLLVGIWSSRYSPRPATEEVFDGGLHWKTLAAFFGGDPLLLRGDDVYGEKPRW